MVDTLSGSIESLFFEYKKKEAMLQHRVGIELSGFRFAPNEIVQDFVNSRLLIDLLSIVDKAVEEMFNFHKLKSKNKKSKLTILIENQKVHNHPYLLWYKEWRNDAAHNFGTIKGHLLRQASDAVQYQLLEWRLISEKFDMSSYETKVDEHTHHYGSIIHDIPVLLYRITYRENGCNWEEKLNLSLHEYFLRQTNSVKVI
jgi:hypothetical protein